MNDTARDRVLAIAAAVFAASYVAAARGLEDSLLSDAVGAGGVPQGVGGLLGAAAVLLFVKTFLRAKPNEPDDDPAWRNVLLRTGGLVLLLLGYAALLPWLGYMLTVCLLVGAAGALAGAPLKLPLALCTVVSGPLLWAMFDRALQVRMPVGTLWGG